MFEEVAPRDRQCNIRSTVDDGEGGQKHELGDGWTEVTKVGSIRAELNDNETDAEQTHREADPAQVFHGRDPRLNRVAQEPSTLNYYWPRFFRSAR